MVQIADASDLKELHYSLSRFENSDEEKSLVQADTAVAFAVFPGSRISISAGDSAGVNAVLKKGPFTTVYIPFPASRWKQGRYALRAVLRTTDTASIMTEFTVRWLNMPSSLTDLDFAIAAMKYYLSEEEYDWLRSGGKAARIQKFEEFWKKKDPTPETAYNEFMAEYFRRVDIAFVQFRTIKEENGVATDRGRIYILYGPPTSIKRTLEPGKAPMEIWKYSSSGKTFVFEDQSRQGDYTLISLSNK
jgi:GWxTD domain-containing protein